MHSIQKRIGTHQGIFFLAIVGLLFMPYLLLTLDMSWSQIKALLIVYAWEAPLFALICIGLPMRWAGALHLEKTADKTGQETPAELNALLRAGLHLPLKIALAMLIVIVVGFAIGILQMIVFAAFDRVQSIQTMLIGIMIAMIYAACCFFNTERILSASLGAWFEKFGMSTPPRVLTLFSKILIVCLSIMIVAILFQGSVAFSHSQRLVQGLRQQGILKEFMPLKPLLQDMRARGQEAEVERVLENASKTLNGHFFILNSKGEVIAGGKGMEPLPWNAEDLTSIFQNLQSQVGPQHPLSAYKDPRAQRTCYGLPLDGADLLLVKAIPFEALPRETTSFLASILISSLIVLFIAFYLSYRLAENASSPLKKLEAVADNIAEGDLSYPVSVITGDEIGALSCSFFRMQQELNRLSRQAASMAGGDLTTHVDFKGDLGAAFNQMQANLREIILEVREAILKISTACNQILASSEEQASGASEQAASVGETTASIEELSTTAGQIAENSDIQAGLAESTQKNAEESAQAMDEAAKLMETIREHTEKGAEKTMSLGEKSQKIGKVLSIINEVAAETKMLSLNAAIEASKAGESGKGFSVVAAEIRKLAENVVKSTGAIEEIAREIQAAANASVMAAEENVKVVKAGAEKLTRVEKAMKEIVDMAEQTTDSAKQVSMATGQQKGASEQVVGTMHELSDVARQMAAAAGESAQSANSLAQMTESLKKILSRFKLEV
jgi:methyl-accepting chemotaxis protein